MTHDTTIVFCSIVIGVLAVDALRLSALGITLLYRRIRKNKNISQSNC